jgi:hypothetical protein
VGVGSGARGAIHIGSAPYGQALKSSQEIGGKCCDHDENLLRFATPRSKRVNQTDRARTALTGPVKWSTDQRIGVGPPAAGRSPGTRSALDAWACRPVPAPAADHTPATLQPLSEHAARTRMLRQPSESADPLAAQDQRAAEDAPGILAHLPLRVTADRLVRSRSRKNQVRYSAKPTP